jgi:hypothetical protein
MSQNETHLIHIALIKDNLSSRIFRIRLSWIPKFGIVLGLLIFWCLLCTALTVRFYYLSSRVQPKKIHTLEQELSDLQAKILALSPPAQPTSTHDANLPQPALVNFTAFEQTAFHPALDSVPIQVDGLTLKHKNNKLEIHFTLVYQGEPSGHQEGKILIVARNTTHVAIYPPGAFELAGRPFLISPERGESFSVSHYRAVHAEFAEQHSPHFFEEIEIYIFNQKSAILFYQSVPVAQEQST